MNLKTSIPFLLIYLTCAMISVSAQDKKQKSTDIEFGIILFDYGWVSIPSQPAMHDGDKDNNYGITNGLFIKKHVNNKSYRIALNYRTASISHLARDNSSSVNDSLDRTGDYSRAVISIGGEKTFLKRKMFQMYWGMDMLLLIGKYAGTSETRTSSFGFDTTTKQSGAGFGSFVGARFTLMDRLRLSVEPRLSALFSQEQTIKRDMSSSRQIDKTKSFAFDNTPQVYAMISYLF